MQYSRIKKVRLFAFDLDGTLLNSQKRLTSRTIAALAEISSKGYKIVFASGRIKSSIGQYLDQCPFPIGILSLNGAAVYSDSRHNFEKLLNVPLPSEYADFLIDYSERKGIAMNYYFEDNLYALRNENNLQWTQLYFEQTNSAYNYIDSFEKFVGKSPSKIIFIGDPGVLDKVQTFFSGLWKGSVYICRTWKYYLEFLNPRANKGTGLCCLASHYNIPMSEVAAFGDASNDIPMLENAGYSIAVSNASDDVKSAATRVSRWSNDEEAVVHEWEFMKKELGL